MFHISFKLHRMHHFWTQCWAADRIIALSKSPAFAYWRSYLLTNCFAIGSSATFERPGFAIFSDLSDRQIYNTFDSMLFFLYLFLLLLSMVFYTNFLLMCFLFDLKQDSFFSHISYHLNLYQYWKMKVLSELDFSSNVENRCKFRLYFK